MTLNAPDNLIQNRSCFNQALWVLVSALVWSDISAAQQADVSHKVQAEVADEIVVTATRLPSASGSAPASVDRIAVDAIKAGLPLIDLSEILNRVPGIVVQNRQNFAQDTQISARGFGARASFGIRGLKLFVDDIPASIPDGQGQGAVIPLFAISSIEVLRGPWAIPFGNGAGGVISASTAAPLAAFSGKAQIESSLITGSDHTLISTLQAGASTKRIDGHVGNDIGGYIATQRFSSDGYRAHSQVHRDQTYARLDIAVAAGHKLMLTGNLIDQPDTADPLGLSRAQFDADARQAPAAALAFNTRKSIHHQQLGLVYDGNAGLVTWKLMAYGGNREVEQYLSTPVAAQTAATSSGGVVALDRQFHGMGMRLSGVQSPWSWTIGMDLDGAQELRRGYENFIRDSKNISGNSIGIKGRQRRDEINNQRALDTYGYLEWALAPDWKTHAALRSNHIYFKSEDHYITAANGDDSGERRYRRVTPAFALVHNLSSSNNVYASVSSGFETPTAAELAYRSDRNYPYLSSGLNLGLMASINRQAEIGFKQRHDDSAVNIALFLVNTSDEIVPAASTAGRTTFQNGGRTSRRGLESSFEWRPSDSGRMAAELAMRFSYTYLDAIFRDGYQVQDTNGRLVASGAVIPGIPRHQFFVEAAWRRDLPGLSSALEWQARSRIFADDANTTASTASGYGVINARIVCRFNWGAIVLQPFARFENLLNKKYVSSVIVNEANQRYFESAPGRRWLAGLNGTLKF